MSIIFLPAQVSETCQVINIVNNMDANPSRKNVTPMQTTLIAYLFPACIIFLLEFLLIMLINDLISNKIIQANDVGSCFF